MNDPAKAAAPLINPETVILRESTDGDLAFVRRSYMRSYWNGGVCRVAHALDKLPRPPQDYRDRMRFQGSFFSIRQVEHLHTALLGSNPSLKLSNAVYTVEQGEVLSRVMDSADVWVAVSPDDTWQILAFIIAGRARSALVLHYVYVKRVYRRLGLATQILKTMAGDRRKLVFTHRTAGWDRWVPQLVADGYDLQFNPYLTR